MKRSYEQIEEDEQLIKKRGKKKKEKEEIANSGTTEAL